MAPSKDMQPLQGSFVKTFFHNQFRVKLNIPTRAAYPSLDGKTAIVTGANTGLGLESAKQLLSLGLSCLVMAVRSIDKGKAAATQIRSANPSTTILVWELDMESYDSIQAFSRRCSQDLPRIDYVILNAGISPLHFRATKDTGHESTVQVNHLSTALLTILLLPIMKGKAKPGLPPTMTIVNSVTAHLCSFPNRHQRPLLASFDDVKITPFDGQERYGVSKLLSQLFLVRLSEQVKSDDVVINMVDPGLTKGTSLARDATGVLGVIVSIFLTLCGRPVDKAASTYAGAVVRQGKASHGCFLMNEEISPLAAFYYSADGPTVSDQIWKETMEELEFAHPQRIIQDMAA